VTFSKVPQIGSAPMAAGLAALGRKLAVFDLIFSASYPAGSRSSRKKGEQ
jgi:hypothetical protein